MIIYEFTNRVQVSTPKGRGFIWFVTQFGSETSLVFCCILDDGTIWEFLPKDIRVGDNETFGRLTPIEGSKCIVKLKQTDEIT